MFNGLSWPESNSRILYQSCKDPTVVWINNCSLDDQLTLQDEEQDEDVMKDPRDADPVLN